MKDNYSVCYNYWISFIETEDGKLNTILNDFQVSISENFSDADYMTKEWMVMFCPFILVNLKMLFSKLININNSSKNFTAAMNTQTQIFK